MYNFYYWQLIYYTYTQHTEKLGPKEFCEKVSVSAILNIYSHNYMTTGYNRWLRTFRFEAWISISF